MEYCSPSIQARGTDSRPSQLRLPAGLQAAVNRSLFRLLSSTFSKSIINPKKPFNKNHSFTEKSDVGGFGHAAAGLSHIHLGDAHSGPCPSWGSSCGHAGDRRLELPSTLGSLSSTDNSYLKSFTGTSLSFDTPRSACFPSASCSPPAPPPPPPPPPPANIGGTGTTGLGIRLSPSFEAGHGGDSGEPQNESQSPTLDSIESGSQRRLKLRQRLHALLDQFARLRSRRRPQNVLSIRTRSGRARNGRDAGKGPTGETTLTTFASASTGANAPNSKRQRDEEDNNNGESNDGDDGGNNRGSKKRSASHRFACPFFKLNPFRFSRCSRFESDNASHVAQHLLRNHSVFICILCNSTFDRQELYNTHVRASRPGPCVIETIADASDRLNENIQLRLKARGKQRGITERQRWYNIWVLIFGHAYDQPQSPYVDDPTGAAYLDGCVDEVKLGNPSLVSQILARGPIESEARLRQVLRMFADAVRGHVPDPSTLPLVVPSSDNAQASTNPAQSHNIAVEDPRSHASAEGESHSQGTNEHVSEELAAGVVLGEVYPLREDPGASSLAWLDERWDSDNPPDPGSDDGLGRHS